MNLKKMYGAVIFGMAVLLTITLVLLSVFSSMINESKKLNQDAITLITLSNDMLRVNNYLIKLMRVFVMDNDPALLEQYYSLLTYDNLEGKLDKMVEVGLAPGELSRLESLFDILEKLAKMESLAIEAHRSGQLESARRIIFSDEYTSADFLLADSTALLISDVTGRVNAVVQDMQDQLNYMRTFINIFVTLTISCLMVLQIMQRRRVLKPVVEIGDLMRGITEGRVGERLVKKHNDEIGLLFDHVNNMADSIEAYMVRSKNSLDTLQNILDGLDALVYVTDPETDIVLFVNKKMEEHFGVKGNAVGQYCYKIFQECMDERCDFCPCTQLDMGFSPTVVWEERNTRTGRIYRNTDRYIEWMGGVKAHLQHSMDITDMKNFAEAKLRAERETLKMKHEKEKAVASAKAKNDFLAKMSHEIRTPMNAVMGMSEIILRKNLPQDVYENAVGIKTASLNLLSIINDILDFSKIESGMMEINEAEYFFPSLINDVSSIIRVRLIDKPIQFAVNIAAGIPACLIGDEIRIRQTLINLLSNAVKYTNEGHIILDVSGVVGDNTVLLSIKVIDSGIGVKPEDFGKLFGDFVQIDTVKNKGIEGTGLGLAISRNLCRMMGGDISLESEYGVGSTFTVTLPQQFQQYIPFASIENPEGKSILLYETRDLYRDSLISAFEGLGVEYESVETIPLLFDKLGDYDYVFISSFMHGSIDPALSKLEKPPTLVLLSDITETFASKNTKILTMPAHSLSIANVLNDVCEEQPTSSGVIGASFTAPDAKVLVVDDVSANLKVCEGLLMPYEMQLTLCSRAKDSVKLLSENRYDLVFMDHMMPEMDGLEVTGIVRAMEGEYYKKLPIIALTANAVSGVREMFIQNGMNDFLSKPIETSRLDSVLEKWIPKEKRVKSHAREQTEVASGFVSSLRSVRELSLDKAISVVGGSFKTYERVVKLSTRLLPENISRLNALIEDDLPNYAIEVHGIKGVLNNLGAYSLGEAAYELELLSKQGKHDRCLELHPGFIERLTAFSDSMQALLDIDEAAEKPKGEVSALLDALPELEEAIDFCDNTTALAVIAKIEPFTYGQRRDELIRGLKVAFERFDFDGAMEFFEELKGGLE